MVTKLPLPKGPSNQTGMGATPGTQQRAKRNLATGGGYNPNMPVGRQIARQAASSYQQSKAAPAPSAAARGMSAAQPRTPQAVSGQAATGRPVAVSGQAATGRPVVTSGQAATGRPAVTQTAYDPTRGYNVLATMTPQEILETNKNLGMSNLTQLGRPEREQTNFRKAIEWYEDPDPKSWTGAESTAATEATAKEAAKDLSELEDASEDSYKSKSYQDMSEEVGESTVDPEAPESPDIEIEDAPEFSKEYEGVPEDLGDDEINSIEGLIDAWKTTNDQDDIGFDPEKKQAAIDALDQKYATHLQQVLMGLDRQAAMAGTFGSAAHTMNINTAVSGALAQMADEYMNLELADLQAVEDDYAEEFAHMQGLADEYQGMFDMKSSLEQLKMAATELGIDQFNAEIQKYLATGEMSKILLEKYGIDAQVFDSLIKQLGIEQGTAVDLLGLEQAGEQLEADLKNNALALASTLFGEEGAGLVAAAIDMIEEQYDSYDQQWVLDILALAASANAAVAGGASPEEAEQIFWEAFAEMMNEIQTYGPATEVPEDDETVSEELDPAAAEEEEGEEEEG